MRRTLLWRVHPARALAEAWLIGVLLLLALSRLTGRVAPAVLGNGVLLLCGTCGLWTVLRARLPGGSAWRQALWELAVGAALSLAMAVGLWLLARLLHWEAAWQGANVGVGGATLLLAGTGPGYLAARAGVRLWFTWNRMRRRRMRWALTHAHLVLILIVVSLLLVGDVLLLTIQSVDRAPSSLSNLAIWLAERLLHTLFPAASVLALLLLVALAVVLPPSALFSFLVARQTTRRLERLARAAAAFRQGDYGTRVEVAGEDELAQLQADFNAMADTLEKTLHDLAAERDTVSRLLQSRRELAANVSHELRTPVATVRAMLESILMRGEEQPPPTWQHDLALIEGEIERLQGLIDDLFALSQVEVDHLAIDCRPAEIGPLVQRVVQAMAPLAWQSGRVQVAAEVAAGLPAAVVDEARLEQVLANLLRNGIQHTPPGGIVAVMASAEEAFVRLEVRDTGSGIAAGDLPHIWERFYRGQSAGGPDQSGAGLGLALVKELTEAMGGSVAVESEVGQGSCFTIRLPKSAQRPELTERPVPGGAE
jgi:signal transduction histidine kinase